MDADIYVLANDRTAETATRVLDKYLPNRKYQIGHAEGKLEYWDDAADTKDQDYRAFDTELELFTFLATQSGILFRPCWQPTVPADLRLIQLYYFQDDSLLIGLNLYQDEEKEERLLAELKDFLGSEYGYIAYNVPPEYGKDAFTKMCKRLK